MRAYPWQSLPRVARGDVEHLAALAARLDIAQLARANERLAALLDVPTAIAAGPIGVLEASSLPRVLSATLVAIAFELPTGRLALELDPSVSLAVIDRVLGGEGHAPPGPALLSALEQGVLAFVAAHVVEGSARVLDVLTTGEGLAAWLGEDAVTWWSLTTSLGARTAMARVWAPQRTLSSLPPVTSLSEAVGEAGVVVHALVGRARLAAAALAQLEVGDVLMPDELSAAALTQGPHFTEVLLRVGPSVGPCAAIARLRRARSAPDSDWQVSEMLREFGAESGAIREAVVNDDDAEVVRTDELSELAEVPIEVTIELGRLTLRVRELAALVPGRVLSARIPVGRDVELRAGERVVARGELVDIEGELGVRITSR